MSYIFMLEKYKNPERLFEWLSRFLVIKKRLNLFKKKSAWEMTLILMLHG